MAIPVKHAFVISSIGGFYNGVGSFVVPSPEISGFGLGTVGSQGSGTIVAQPSSVIGSGDRVVTASGNVQGFITSIVGNGSREITAVGALSAALPSVVGVSNTLQAIEFDGTSYVTEVGDYDRTTADYTTTPFTTLQSNDFSWAMWIKPTSDNDNVNSQVVESNIIMDGDLPGGAEGGSHIIGIQNDRIIVGYAEQQSSNDLPATYRNFSASTIVNDDAWHWIVFCWDASAGRLQVYVDGAREIDQTNSPDTGDLWWNASGSDADADIMEWGGEKGEATLDGGYFGRISEVILYDADISDGASLTVPTTPISQDSANIVWMPDFTLGTGTSITDLKGGPAMLVVEGGSPTAPRWIDDSPY